MNVVLWVLQVLVGLQFIFHSYIMAVRYEQMKTLPRMGWLGELPASLRNIIALAEFLGGVGMIVPAATGIVPWLTPLAALGLAITMILAIGYHLARNEYPSIVLNSVLLILAAFVAYGRFAIAPL